MARVVVIGGSDGLDRSHAARPARLDVGVLDRDPVAPDSVDAAWDSWERRSVTQFRQVHFLQAGGRAVLDKHVPRVAVELERAGAVRFNAIEQLGALLPGGGRQRLLVRDPVPLPQGQGDAQIARPRGVDRVVRALPATGSGRTAPR